MNRFLPSAHDLFDVDSANRHSQLCATLARRRQDTADLRAADRSQRGGSGRRHFIRIGRRPLHDLRLGKRFGACQGGGNNGQRCSINEDCPGGTCPTACVGAPNTVCANDGECGGNGPCGRNFDFTGLVDQESLLLQNDQYTTPVVLPGMCQEDSNQCMASCGMNNPCANYAFEAGCRSRSVRWRKAGVLRGFTTSEAVAGEDLNGDGDLKTYRSRCATASPASKKILPRWEGVPASASQSSRRSMSRRSAIRRWRWKTMYRRSEGL